MSKPRLLIELQASDKFCHVDEGPTKCQFAFQLDNGKDTGSWFCQFFGTMLKKNNEGKLERIRRCLDEEKKFLDSFPATLELKVKQQPRCTCSVKPEPGTDSHEAECDLLKRR